MSRISRIVATFFWCDPKPWLVESSRRHMKEVGVYSAVTDYETLHSHDFTSRIAGPRDLLSRAVRLRFPNPPMEARLLVGAGCLIVPLWRHTWDFLDAANVVSQVDTALFSTTQARELFREGPAVQVKFCGFALLFSMSPVMTSITSGVAESFPPCRRIHRNSTPPSGRGAICGNTI